jgi:predicted transcriptional regulator
MKTVEDTNALQETDEKAELTNILRKSEESCRGCHPITPITCVIDCKIWKLKNEFREVGEKLKNQNFTVLLLNALKNKRRLQILNMISKTRYSITGLQRELRKQRYYHSQKTIAEEYVAPLVEAGLAKQEQDKYYATLFGCKFAELKIETLDIEEALPPHSECYEELALNMLLNKPLTHEDFQDAAIPTKSLPRVLNRLQKTGLIQTPKENDYVFYFQTKRSPNKTRFSPTEKRVYENIPFEGISAQKLAGKTAISLRRTYKYLRRLKGKKMVFIRRKPKSYSLTDKGFQLAMILEKVLNLVTELSVVANQASKTGEIQSLPTLEPIITRK